ncbi:SRPBCC family protein [Chryseobacterium sp. GMJ5]|uniref:SRPBCC family protein n=1 Tax=Chryseobacterium gilvum TaxID=2976534 RepID=A0ABT2VVC8_9FLAO|nr:SRPBCC family protein [Chryseobacterium gilvum]MCU7613960.1 SRPBCC family protein [Chryseobacterium gilvum]
MEPITINSTISAPVQKVWDYFNTPDHITKWNFAHESWQCPSSENDLRAGGKFKTRMEAKDGSFGFDFEGIYDEVIPGEKIKYHLEDGRNVEIQFQKIDGDTTKVIQIFDPEQQNPIEMQRDGWYAILNNFQKYVENN